MARAHVVHPDCVDELCSIDGKDVKKSLHENEPYWLNDIKFFAVVIAVALVSNFALYIYE